MYVTMVRAILKFKFLCSWGMLSTELLVLGFLLSTCLCWLLFLYLVFIGNSWKMKLPYSGLLYAESPNRRLFFCNILPAAVFVTILFFVGTSFVTFDYKEKESAWQPPSFIQTPKSNLLETTKQSTQSNSPESNLLETTKQSTQSNSCQNQDKPSGSELLPKGIITRTTDLEMQPLWGSPPKRKVDNNVLKCLLAIPVGIKQKKGVDQIVRKFFSSNFSVMLFHYDGVVSEWRDLSWSDKALHISAINQTKWWFAKRFLHPDIVADYDYIFLWDEDLEVQHFNPDRYLSIIKREGLEISQPALDASSYLHYQITARQEKEDVHRRVYQSHGSNRCYENSTAPPCTGWVEMMAPVFSRAAWRCVWYMVQNDLIHAWGLDFKLGYCAQGDWSKTVGVVDSEYLIHRGRPILGGPHEIRNSSGSHTNKDRFAVRKRSLLEQEIFEKRWGRAVAGDKCWVYPF